MYITIAIKIDSDFINIKLKKKELKEYNLWEGNIENRKESNVLIFEKNDEIKIEKSSDIETSIEEIKEIFIEAIKKTQLDRNDSEYDGIEFEQSDYDEEDENCINPYDSELIRVDTRNLSMNYIYEMMCSEENELDLSPDFQRNFVWNDITRKSRLIESLLLRIPLPVFYFSQDVEGKYQVIDGVQRLTVIKSFLNNEFKLKNLEYLTECEGLFYKKNETHKNGMEYLDGKYVRRLNQTQLICNIIDPQTPSKVKFDIFKRINTGGVRLNPQEIRNCLSNDRTRNLLKKLSLSDEFKEATGNSINSSRMADQELVLRFIGFYYERMLNIHDLKYKGNMEEFLDQIIEILNNEDASILSLLESKFKLAMKNALHLFKEYAFRKCKVEHLEKNAKKQLINKSLFVTISIWLSQYEYENIKEYNEGYLAYKFAEKIGKDKKYLDVLTNGTNDLHRLNKSFDISHSIILDELEVIKL